MVAYIGAKVYFCADDELLGEQPLQYGLRFKGVERDGIGAMDYYGKDPRAMMDQVLFELPTQARFLCEVILGFLERFS